MVMGQYLRMTEAGLKKKVSGQTIVYQVIQKILKIKFSVLDEGPTDDITIMLVSQKKNSVLIFFGSKTRFCLILHDNGYES